ncbi:MAG: sugar phosphate isomerase/epimerase [Kiritimatiellae bacterium]|nr:sugar phosphate isomerase/epimerase [Kiritimatiellia bacterium]
MDTTRREFLRSAVMGGMWMARGGGAAPTAKESPLFGACRGPDQQALLKEVGYDFWEGSVGPLLMPGDPDDAFEAKTGPLLPLALPIRSCTGFIPASLPLVGPNVDAAAIERHARTTFRRAQRLGIQLIVLGSGGARKIPAGFDPARAREQFLDICRRMGPLAAEHGVTVVLEPLNRSETNFFHTVAEGIEMVDAVGHPNIQLLADIYHMLREEEGPDSIRKAGARLRHCHIAEKVNRAPPGTSGEDFRPYFRALKEIGYRGGISIEGRWGRDIEADLRRALEVMRRQWSEA